QPAPGAPAARPTAARLEPGARPVGTGNGLGRAVTGLSARLAERDAAARRLRRVRLAVAAGVVVVLGAVAWALLVSPLFALRTDAVDLRVTGTTVDEAEVRDVLAPAVGTPLLRVRAAGLAERLGRVVEVEHAEVVRAWPHGLTVRVTAREPVAAAPAPEGGWALVDGDGVRVGSVGEVPEGLPEVTVPLGDSAETAPALRAVLGVLAALPPDLLGQVAQAGATGTAQVTLTLDDGAAVRWGSAEENALKTEVLRVLRQQPAGVYDVSVPRSPTTA
ncbi:cell division protein FtsQ/DivIB, partial [Georgenia ruanii]|uniref:cell division protein FtsQ/DivIB n=1 Tax=Georgenia ruanii TaxID=348442 RepID=UPI0031D1AFAD